jgi:hypothetical protein
MRKPFPHIFVIVYAGNAIAACLDALLLRKLQEFLESWHPRATSLWRRVRRGVAVMQMRLIELIDDRQHAGLCICSLRYDSLAAAGRWLNYCNRCSVKASMAKCGVAIWRIEFLPFRRLILSWQLQPIGVVVVEHMPTCRKPMKGIAIKPKRDGPIMDGARPVRQRQRTIDGGFYLSGYKKAASVSSYRVM